MSKPKVAAYIRMGDGTDSSMLSSFTLQKEYFHTYITNTPEWELAGIYTDRGPNCGSLGKRPGLAKLLCDCREGKVNLILMKGVSNLHRDAGEALKIIRELLELNPPVGIIFESNAVNTLEPRTMTLPETMKELAIAESDWAHPKKGGGAQ